MGIRMRKRRRLPSFRTWFSCYVCPDSVITGDGKDRVIYCKKMDKETKLLHGKHYPEWCPSMKGADDESTL